MTFSDFEAAFAAWKYWRAFDKKHLPCEGGLLDQPADLVTDVLTVEFMYQQILKDRKGDERI